MHIDRRLLGWGVFLVLLGAIPLATDQGWLPDDIGWWQLWPLILIGIGLSVMLRRTSLDGLGGLVVAASFGLIIGGSIASSSFPGFNGGCLGGSSGTGFAAQRGSLTDPQGDITLDMSCGSVTVTTGAGSDWTLSGTSDGGRVPDLERASGRLRIATPNDSFFGDRSDWQVVLPSAPTLSLSTTVSGGSGRLDLAGATLDAKREPLRAALAEALYQRLTNPAETDSAAATAAGSKPNCAGGRSATDAKRAAIGRPLSLRSSAG